AGRGPLAGPVVAAAVILDPTNIPSGLNDSKKLTEKKRLILFDEIVASSQIAFASVSASKIDEINIRQATLLAMSKCVMALGNKAGHILIDGRDVPLPLNNIGTAVIKGDGISVSIAAASIIAKVMRDKMMIKNAEYYPPYGFDGHKGYGSAKHIEAIKEHGACALHRKSFAPIKDM
ncbi:MAG: ribonuclease HII, partial [Nitratireductor sp.]